MKQINRLFLFLIILTPFVSKGQGYHMKPVQIQTRWAKNVSETNNLNEYPRPQMVRKNWTNLNGLWDYAILSINKDKPAAFDGKILVPYPLESALSGVKELLEPNQNLWYRKLLTRTASENGDRTILHFGAVDYETTVYINGKKAGSHIGGYTAFHFDISEMLQDGENEILVKVQDPSDRGVGPHGKQVLNPANIYYTPSSGIWQTVWLETVPVNAIQELKITPDLDNSSVKVSITAPRGLSVKVTALNRSVVSGLAKGMTNEELNLKVKTPKLWSPASPFLYDLRVELYKNDILVDQVSSYFGMRKISVAKDSKGADRIFLNNKPYFNLGTLDQGFWPDGLYTAPTDEALAFDIKAIKAMGFNTIRKHIKVEPARWYYYADKIGMLVWQDMVNPNQRLPEGSKAAFEHQSQEILEQLHNFPSISTWVLFNEKWGQYDQERLTKWIKHSDPSRIVNGHSGEYLYVNNVLRSPSPNAYVGADMTDVHAYPDPMNSIKIDGKAQICGEFGGIGVSIPDHQWIPEKSWGYIEVRPEELKVNYSKMIKQLEAFHIEGLSGSIYTQPFDVEGEENGIMTYDRQVVKIPFAELRKIHSTLNPNQGVIPGLKSQIAGQTDFDKRYKAALKTFESGKSDQFFLKQFAMLAKQAMDIKNSELAVTMFISSLNRPNKEDVEFLKVFLKNSKSRVFNYFIQNSQMIDSVAGDRFAENPVQNAIFKDYIEQSVSGKGSTPDFDAIERDIVQFGENGKEIFLKAKYVHFFNIKDVEHFADAFHQYFSAFPKAAEPELNNYAWLVFERSKNISTLSKALSWSKASLAIQPSADFKFVIPVHYDTYANLLYKLDRKEEAILLEKKAIAISKEIGSPASVYKEFENVLSKMESGQPTWPIK